MANGDTLVTFDAMDHHPPRLPGYGYGTLSPTADLRGEGRYALTFPDCGTHGPQNYSRWAFFEAVMPRAYAGGGAILSICTAAVHSNTGSAIWHAGFERHQSGMNLAGDAWAAPRGGWYYPNAVVGVPSYALIGFESNAAIGGIQVGEHFRFYLQIAWTDMYGWLQLYGVELLEHVP